MWFCSARLARNFRTQMIPEHDWSEANVWEHCEPTGRQPTPAERVAHDAEIPDRASYRYDTSSESFSPPFWPLLLLLFPHPHPPTSPTYRTTRARTGPSIRFGLLTATTPLHTYIYTQHTYTPPPTHTPHTHTHTHTHIHIYIYTEHTFSPPLPPSRSSPPSLLSSSFSPLPSAFKTVRVLRYTWEI